MLRRGEGERQKEQRLLRYYKKKRLEFILAAGCLLPCAEAEAAQPHFVHFSRFFYFSRLHFEFTKYRESKKKREKERESDGERGRGRPNKLKETLRRK